MLSARLKQYYGRLRRPPGTHPLPGLPVIGHAAPATPSAGHRAGEGLPRSRRHHRYVPRPLRRGVLHGCSPGSTPLPWPSPRQRGLGTPPPRLTEVDGRHFTTPQASLHATDRIVAPPLSGLLTLGFDPARFQTKPPACYRAPWRLPGPDFHRQATTSLRTRSTATSRLHLLLCWAHAAVRGSGHGLRNLAAMMTRRSLMAMSS